MSASSETSPSAAARSTMPVPSRRGEANARKPGAGTGGSTRLSGRGGANRPRHENEIPHPAGGTPQRRVQGAAERIGAPVGLVPRDGRGARNDIKPGAGAVAPPPK